MLQVAGKLGSVAVDVPATAKQNVRNARVLLAPPPWLGALADSQCRCGGMDDAGEGDQLHTRCLPGGDDVGVLSDAPSYLGAGHQEEVGRAASAWRRDASSR